MINRVKDLLNEISSLPPKLRSKSGNAIDFMHQCLKTILPLVERSPDLRFLSRDAQRAVTLHNVPFLGGINATLVAREANAYKNTIFMTGSSVLFGNDFMMKCAQDNERFLPNGNLYRLMFFVLMFSSNCSIIIFKDKEDIRTTASSIELIHMQDIYVTTVWKYLIYLYGFNGAVMHFSAIVKNILDFFARTEEVLKNLSYNILVDKVVTQLECSLSVAD